MCVERGVALRLGERREGGQQFFFGRRWVGLQQTARGCAGAASRRNDGGAVCAATRARALQAGGTPGGPRSGGAHLQAGQQAARAATRPQTQAGGLGSGTGHVWRSQQLAVGSALSAAWQHHEPQQIAHAHVASETPAGGPSRAWRSIHQADPRRARCCPSRRPSVSGAERGRAVSLLLPPPASYMARMARKCSVLVRRRSQCGDARCGLSTSRSGRTPWTRCNRPASQVTGCRASGPQRLFPGLRPATGWDLDRLSARLAAHTVQGARREQGRAWQKPPAQVCARCVALRLGAEGMGAGASARGAVEIIVCGHPVQTSSLSGPPFASLLSVPKRTCSPRLPPRAFEKLRASVAAFHAAALSPSRLFLSLF
jgi:hypothetical protein